MLFYIRVVIGFGFLVFMAASASLSSPANAALPGPLDTIAVDTDISGNTPTSIATIETCRVADVGTSFEIDIIVDEIPPIDPVNSNGGILGTGFDLIYNPSVLRIAAIGGSSTVLFYQNQPLGFYFDGFSGTLPDNDGDYRHDITEIAPLGGPSIEVGEGVLTRLTIDVIGPGVSALDLDDLVFGDFTPKVVDGYANYYYNVNNVLDGEVRANGSACPDQDADGVQDSADNCPAQSNPSQTDENADEIGDVCDSVGGEVLITSDTARQSGLPRAWLVGASLLAIGLGTGTLWRLRRR